MTTQTSLKHRCRRKFPKGKFHRHTSGGCRAAVVVCLGCQHRGCRHFLRAKGELDLETGELANAGKGVGFKKLTGDNHKHLPLGLCAKCSRDSGSAGIDMGDSVAAILETVKHVRARDPGVKEARK